MVRLNDPDNYKLIKFEKSKTKNKMYARATTGAWRATPIGGCKIF